MTSNRLVFRNVVGRLFPLRADPDILQAFVDRYLNRPDYGHNYHFVAYPSTVQLQVLNYGYMGVAGVDDFKETQSEMLFAVPLLWFEADPNGAYEFHDKRYRLNKHSTATVTPFVFVDNKLSLWGGREIYGWPKTLMNLQPDVSRWMTSPLLERNLVSIYGSFLEKEDRDERPHYMPIVDIDQEVDSSLHFESPQKNRPPPWLTSLERINRTMTDSYMQAFNLWRDTVSNMGPRPTHLMGKYTDPDIDLSPASALTSYEIGLKQFRDANDPNNACYMALGCTSSTITAINGAGLLGTAEKSAQLSGGYRVRIHHYDARPIITTLGIKLADLVEEKGHLIGVAEPVMPLWLDFNSSFGGGESLSEFSHGRKLDGGLQRDAYPPFESEYFDPNQAWEDKDE